METKERILEEALAELERNGVHNFSLRAVGAAVGITPMAIYRHYRDKDALLQAVGEEAFAQWQRRIAAIRSSDPQHWFRRSARAYVEFALDEPARFDACFVLSTHAERVYPQGFRAGQSPVVTLAMERIVTAQAARQLQQGDALEIALYVWAQIHGLAMLHRSGRFALPRSEFLALCDRCIDRILGSLAPQKPTRRKPTRKST
ncbi:MAG TPA: TetR/AcrR family transcriptional regulator [Povalibacter sp.]|nr:TetR/AcrR family transcriptional regulator [Povalibacter sp.]